MYKVWLQPDLRDSCRWVPQIAAIDSRPKIRRESPVSRLRESRYCYLRPDLFGPVHNSLDCFSPVDHVIVCYQAETFRLSLGVGFRLQRIQYNLEHVARRVLGEAGKVGVKVRSVWVDQVDVPDTVDYLAQFQCAGVHVPHERPGSQFPSGSNRALFEEVPR